MVMEPTDRTASVRIGGPLDWSFEIDISARRSMSCWNTVDIFQGRTLLLSLSELGGPGLEVRKDLPRWLNFFWDLSDTVYPVPDSWCPLLGTKQFGLLLMKFCQLLLLLLQLRF